MTPAGRTANVLGALALVVSDQTDRAVAARSGQSASSAAALSALHEFLDQPTVEKLREVLGLTPSGAVRLIDRLVEAGLVTRGPGADGRSRSVSLTDEGRRAAADITAARAGVLADMTAGLTDDEFDSLHGLLSRVMANAVRTKSGGGWICRMCDLAACERDLGRCPAANTARTARQRTPQDDDITDAHTKEDTP